jgi:putative two-component system response regulator
VGVFAFLVALSLIARFSGRFRHTEPSSLVPQARSLPACSDELESAEAVLRSLALMIEARDPSTDGHCHRLAEYAVALGRRLGLPDEDLVTLRRGGYFHDIGKIAIPDAILMKPGPLTPQEHARLREHPATGERLCGDLRALDRVRPIVRWHHELLDGSGYPDGLRGDAIPVLAQIIGIVDVYDALTSSRPYRSVALSPGQACTHLLRNVEDGRRSARLVHEFVAVIRDMQEAPVLLRPRLEPEVKS